MASYLILRLIWIFFCVVSLSSILFCLSSFYLFLFFYHLCLISFPPFCCSLCLRLFLCALPSPLCFCISFLFSSFHPLPFFPSLHLLRPPVLRVRQFIEMVNGTDSEVRCLGGRSPKSQDSYPGSPRPFSSPSHKASSSQPYLPGTVQLCSAYSHLEIRTCLTPILSANTALFYIQSQLSLN